MKDTTDLVLLKIGGSICTEKSKGRFKVKKKTVKRIATEILEARKQRDFRLLVVNGAGPFGHVNVAEYDIDNGLLKPPDFDGFSKTVCDCDYVNYMVSEILRENGHLAYPFPSSSVIAQSGKKIITFNFDQLKRLWDISPDIIPVMNGTMVPDLELKGSVVGGDAVIEHIAKNLSVSMVIFAADIDGIFTRDPKKNKKAKLIDVITKENFEDLKHGISGSASIDVTGGMLGKVERLLSTRTETLVINGNKAGRVRDALLGKNVKGTVIKP
jgi:isopentenyl phosphate kinase